MKAPALPKLFVGISDVVTLQLFLQQQWQWPTIHGATDMNKFSAESIAALKSLLFAEAAEIIFQGSPLNAAAKEDKTIESTVRGGNLTLIQTSIGTAWQINGNNKIILLEEVCKRGYRVDRMLEHLSQAHIFDEASAIVLGMVIRISLYRLEPERN